MCVKTEIDESHYKCPHASCNTPSLVFADRNQTTVHDCLPALCSPTEIRQKCMTSCFPGVRRQKLDNGARLPTFLVFTDRNQ